MVREAASKFDCVQFMREARARVDAETEDVADEGRALGRGMFTQGDDWADLKKMARDAIRCRFDGVAAEFAGRSKRAVCAPFFE